MRSILFFVLGLALGHCIITTVKYYTQPKVDLPEEYKLIKPSDNLKGYMDKDSVLHIQFNNPNNNQ